MGSVYVLHASLTEYVLFFGTAVDTQGHSGIYILDLCCTREGRGNPYMALTDSVTGVIIRILFHGCGSKSVFP